MTALLRSVAGLIVWAIAFSALYALQGLACAGRWDDMQLAGVSLARLVLLAVYGGGIGLLALLCWRCRPRVSRPQLLDWLAFASAAAGLFSLVYTGLPVITVSICQ
jgi:hypothetical protein